MEITIQGLPQATNMVSNLSIDFTDFKKELLENVAVEAEAQLKILLQSQPSDWKKLDDKYLAQKIRRGESEKTLIATSAMFQAITSFVIGNKAFAGVSKNAYNKEGKSVANIAAILEFGSVVRNIPARPLYSKVEGLMQPIVERISLRLSKKYFGVSK